MTEPASQPASPAAPLTEAEDKQWASFAHFGNILSFIPPLIIWLIFKDRGVKTNVEAKEALNWQITFLIGWVALTIIGTILLFVGIGIVFTLLSWALYILNVVFSILGFVKVNNGGSYRYPFALRLIK